MVENGVIQELYRNVGNFTKSDTLLFEYIREHYKDIIYYSITELSEATNVAEATILRFCKKNGYLGYQDFKISIAKMLSTDDKHTVKMEKDHTLMEEVYDNLILTLQKNKEVIDYDLIKQAVDYIEKANHVIFVGAGSSGITAVEAVNKFLRIGNYFQAFTEGHFGSMAASNLTPNDVLIAISVSGSTKDTNDIVKIAKSNNCTVIAITSYLKSPMSKLSDLVLLSVVKETPFESGSFNVKISQLFVIDLLAAELASRKKSITNIKEKIAKSVSEKIY